MIVRIECFFQKLRFVERNYRRLLYELAMIKETILHFHYNLLRHDQTLPAPQGSAACLLKSLFAGSLH